jgi:glucose/arabinose dehydrogenase
MEDSKMLRFVSAAAVSLALMATGSLAAEPGKLLTGEAAFGNWQDDAPGVKRLIKPEDLPEAVVDESEESNGPETVAMPEGAKPKVPEGFSVEMVASGLEQARVIRVAPNGDLFVANSEANEVRVYRVAEGKSKPDEESVFASGLNKPYGIAFYPPGPNPEWVYIANTDGVVRFPYKNGDLDASGVSEILVAGFPTSRHWTRDLAFSPDGTQMFVSIGSGSNVAENMIKEMPDGFAESRPLGATWGSEEKRADVLVFNPEGKDEKIFATGLRNCSGMTVQPKTGALWCVVNERDRLGDNVPFDYATHVEQGAFFGWPWYYIGGNPDPRLADARPDLISQVTVPDVLFQAHSAPLGITFYDGGNFPAEYRGDAFVTMHGSWNRDTRTGYKVVRLHFDDNGQPTGEYEDFMTGFVISDRDVWGRPVGVAVAKDGSLFVTEDGSGTIWRVTHAAASAS